jgi:DNA repair protein RecO (recombination protein O)
MAENALALVVRGTDWSETSRITTLFTREFGKVRALAKGGRRLRSNFEIAFDLLTVCHVVYLRKAHGGLDLLIEAQVAERFPHLRTDRSALNIGYYVAELLSDGTQDYDPHPELFDAAIGTLRVPGKRSPRLSLSGSGSLDIAPGSMRAPCVRGNSPCLYQTPPGSGSAPRPAGWCARTAFPPPATADRCPNRPGSL